MLTGVWNLWIIVQASGQVVRKARVSRIANNRKTEKKYLCARCAIHPTEKIHAKDGLIHGD